MKIMCIWTKDKKDTVMDVIRSKSDMKRAVVAGRKPDKIIARSSEIEPLTIKNIKSQVSYDGVVIIDGKVVYDGKHGLK